MLKNEQTTAFNIISDCRWISFLVFLWFRPVFYHRQERLVHKDGTVSVAGKHFEVPYELTGQHVMVVFDPEGHEAKWVESKNGDKLGDAVPCDPVKNCYRKRCRPAVAESTQTETIASSNLVESAYEAYKSTLKFQS